jgi:hypothetical protein
MILPQDASDFVQQTHYLCNDGDQMLKTDTLIHVKLHHITHNAESGRRGDHAQLDAIPLAKWFTNTLTIME